MNPTQTCTVCNRRRDCLEHMRAEFPPDAAKAWLKRTCEQPKPKPCDFQYRAGVA